MSKVILITGSSSGFGRLIALTLIKQGYRVYASMRATKGKNVAIAQELSDAGAQVIELDVIDKQSVQLAIDTIGKNENKIDVLINNAGVAASGISESFQDDQVQEMFDVNVFGMFRVTQAVLPIMRRQQEGLVINIGSILGRVTFPFFALYGASKYAVEAMTDGFSYELSQLGIDVVLVQPSAYPTNMYSNAIVPNNPQLSADYGDVANIPNAIGATIASIFESDDAPEPIDIANTISTLIIQPSGSRSKRVVVGNSFGADAINEKVAPIQSQLLEGLGLRDLESVKV